jgi:hypothetical protein
MEVLQMLVKVFGKTVWGLVLVVLLVSTALAAPGNSALVGEKKDKDALFEQELDGGGKIVFNKIAEWKEGSELRILITYIVTFEEEDTIIKVQGGTIYDNQGNEFNSIRYTRIGNKEASERLVVAGVPTTIEFAYRCDKNYKLASVFPRVGLTLNGKDLSFRDVPGKQ